jgi:predicted Zn-dependent protease
MRRVKGFLAGALVCLVMAQPAYSQAKPEPGQAHIAVPERDYKFTKIDFELLKKVQQFDRYLEEQGYVYSQPEVTAYVRRVGEAMLPAETPANVVWQFRVVRDPMPNAFALPNGSIYVHTGLLALLENEAQLASVLAHEVRHVLGYHGYLQNRSQRKKMVAIHVLYVAVSVADAAGGWGSVASAVVSMIPMMVVATIYGYSRELEREADVKAFTAMNEAGYSTEEMPVAFKLLKTTHEVELQNEPTFYRSHPQLEERIQYITELVNTIRAKVPHPKLEAEAYAAAVEKATRHNVYLDIQSGRARTAVVTAQGLVRRNPSAENFLALGDAYRGLGPLVLEPTKEEQSPSGKKETRKMLAKATPQEYDAALWKKPGAQDAWAENRKQAEDGYRKALEGDANNGGAYRGLGFLYEREKRAAEAVEAFRKYLELAPNSTDRAQIKRRLEALEKELPPPATTTPGTPGPPTQ